MERNALDPDVSHLLLNLAPLLVILIRIMWKASANSTTISRSWDRSDLHRMIAFVEELEGMYMYVPQSVCRCVCVCVGSCLATKVFIGNLPAMGRRWVIIK